MAEASVSTHNARKQHRSGTFFHEASCVFELVWSASRSTTRQCPSSPKASLCHGAHTASGWKQVSTSWLDAFPARQVDPLSFLGSQHCHDRIHYKHQTTSSKCAQYLVALGLGWGWVCLPHHTQQTRQGAHLCMPDE